MPRITILLLENCMKISKSLMLKLLIFLPVITIFYCNTVFAYAIGDILKDDSVSLDVTKDTQLEDTLMNLSLPAATFMSTPVTVSGASVIPLHQENTQKDTGKNRRIKNIITPSTEYNYKKGIDASKQLLSGDFGAQAYRDNKLVTEKNDTAKNAISEHNLWRVDRGGILFNILSQWCADAGWTLVWKTNDSYRVLSAASFSGDFVTAVRKLFSSIGMQNLNVYIRFYTGNKVLLVTSEPLISD